MSQAFCPAETHSIVFYRRRYRKDTILSLSSCSRPRLVPLQIFEANMRSWVYLWIRKAPKRAYADLYVSCGCETEPSMVYDIIAVHLRLIHEMSQAQFPPSPPSPSLFLFDIDSSVPTVPPAQSSHVSTPDNAKTISAISWE